MPRGRTDAEALFTSAELEEAAMNLLVILTGSVTGPSPVSRDFSVLCVAKVISVLCVEVLSMFCVRRS